MKQNEMKQSDYSKNEKNCSLMNCILKWTAILGGLLIFISWILAMVFSSKVSSAAVAFGNAQSPADIAAGF